MGRRTRLALVVLVSCADLSPRTGAEQVATDAGAGAEGGAPATAIIGSLAITTVGSTVDATNGDQNPYGLAVAPVTAGLLTAGDLVVCNFNDAANVQGNGTTLEILHPIPGSTPARMVQDPDLKGCAALAIAADDAPWVAAYSSDLAPFYTPEGVLQKTLAGGPWSGPWGEAFATGPGATGTPSFVTSNATSGTVVRVAVDGSAFTTIVTGFTLNAGAVPGNILGASGLTYDVTTDTLFVVDSNQNRVVAFAGYSDLGENAVVVEPDGTFSGPSAASARVVFAGAPLNAPIGAARLFDGDLVVGNTGDNVLVEISPGGQLVATQNLDTGAAGALFGIVATGTDASSTRIYFVDDNDSTVKVLAP
ncbi:MAG TPA: hypothetical protein VIF09_26985 [Polyangiaceae bacterium]